MQQVVASDNEGGLTQRRSDSVVLTDQGESHVRKLNRWGATYFSAEGRGMERTEKRAEGGVHIRTDTDRQAEK